MKTPARCAVWLLVTASLFNSSCQKEISTAQQSQKDASQAVLKTPPPFDLNVSLKGENDAQGQLKFRQDPDAAKIIDLDIKVHNLEPNHAYLLQRAVDPINVVDGNCTSIGWLTLGKGLTPQSILTDADGNDEEDLWRDVTAIPAGSGFDIHFQVIDAVTSAVVLTSDCYQYTVR